MLFGFVILLRMRKLSVVLSNLWLWQEFEFR